MWENIYNFYQRHLFTLNYKGTTEIQKKSPTNQWKIKDRK